MAAHQHDAHDDGPMLAEEPQIVGTGPLIGPGPARSQAFGPALGPALAPGLGLGDLGSLLNLVPNKSLHDILRYLSTIEQIDASIKLLKSQPGHVDLPPIKQMIDGHHYQFVVSRLD